MLLETDTLNLIAEQSENARQISILLFGFIVPAFLGGLYLYRRYLSLENRLDENDQVIEPGLLDKVSYLVGDFVESLFNKNYR